MIDLAHAGLSNLGPIHHNLSTPELYEAAIQRGEAQIGHLGPLVVNTGKYTGRSANDKFVVDEPTSTDDIWWGPINKPFSEDDFETVLYGLRQLPAEP